MNHPLAGDTRGNVSLYFLTFIRGRNKFMFIVRLLGRLLLKTLYVIDRKEKEYQTREKQLIEKLIRQIQG